MQEGMWQGRSLFRAMTYFLLVKTLRSYIPNLQERILLLTRENFTVDGRIVNHRKIQDDGE